MSKANKTTEIALSVQNISKTFKLPHERHNGIKSALISMVGGKHKSGYERQKVLNDVSFDIQKGEFFGIVGRNGSGKSTLLKLLAGIYVPDSGKIIVKGSLTPFIELGVGFNPNLTGRENVFLNGALLGFSRQEMEAKYDDIVEFAELEDFMDQKLKNYSSGMQVRLAFAIAIQSDSDILILDEVLAVGDEAFQRKCNDYFTKIKEDPSKTVILVTHGMDNVKKYCDRAMMIQDGKIVTIGDPEDVSSAYSLANAKVGRDSKESDNILSRNDNIKTFTVDLISPVRITENDAVEVEVSYMMNETTNTYAVVGLNAVGTRARVFTKKSDIIRSVKGELISTIFNFDISLLNDVTIKVMAAVYDENDNILAFNEEQEMPRFQISRTDYGIRERTSALLINDQ